MTKENGRGGDEAAMEKLMGAAIDLNRDDHRRGIDELGAELDALRDAKQVDKLRKKAHGLIPEERDD